MLSINLYHSLSYIYLDLRKKVSRSTAGQNTIPARQRGSPVLAGKAFLCKQGNNSTIFLSPQRYNGTPLFVNFFYKAENEVSTETLDAQCMTSANNINPQLTVPVE